MNNRFKVGDKVKISNASEYYGISRGNPKDVEGVITGISGEVGSLPYYVQWSNETRNNYEASDLIKVEEVKENKEKSIHDILVERSTLEVGDVVMVTHKVPSYDLGWTSSWIGDHMDAMIGKESVVTRVPSEGGVRLEDCFVYPLQSVQLVCKGPRPIHVHISDDYIAEVTKKGIKINDQMITFEDFDELVKAVAKIRK